MSGCPVGILGREGDEHRRRCDPVGGFISIVVPEFPGVERDEVGIARDAENDGCAGFDGR